MSLNEGPTFFWSTAWQLRQPLAFTTSAPDWANTAPVARTPAAKPTICINLMPLSFRLEILANRGSARELPPPIIVRDQEEIDFLDRILDQPGAVGVNPGLPGPVVAAVAVVDVVETDPGVLLQGVLPVHGDARELGGDVRDGVDRRARRDRLLVVLVRDLGVAQVGPDVDLLVRLAPHAGAEVVAVAADRDAPDRIRGARGAHVVGRALAARLVQARGVERVPRVRLQARSERIAGVDRVILVRALAHPEPGAVAVAVAVPRVVHEELDGERLGRHPGARQPHLVALAVGEVDRRDEVAAGGAAGYDGLLKGRAVAVAVDIRDRAGERLGHHAAQLELVRQLVGGLPVADDPDGRGIAPDLVPAYAAGHPERGG